MSEPTTLPPVPPGAPLQQRRRSASPLGPILIVVVVGSIVSFAFVIAILLRSHVPPMDPDCTVLAMPEHSWTMFVLEESQSAEGVTGCLVGNKEKLEECETTLFALHDAKTIYRPGQKVTVTTYQVRHFKTGRYTYFVQQTERPTQ